jgi:hypothetical protein
MRTIYALLTHPENGYPSDVDNAKNLKSDTYYEVERVSMSQSHTNIFLKDIKGGFSSVQFYFYDKDKNPIDIYSMPEFNHYMPIGYEGE